VGHPLPHPTRYKLIINMVNLSHNIRNV
jgi:hypothetical protein